MRAMSWLMLVVAILAFVPGVSAQEVTAVPTHSDARTCAECHTDPHEDAAACETCHTTEAWSPTTFDVVRHAETAFALHGKHEAVACGSCHTDGKLKGLPSECAGCHVDRHRGKLGGECTDCHSDAGFTPVANFDHAQTGFVVEGAHASNECADCHTGVHGRAMTLLNTDATCTTCHTPRHGDLGQTCADCHGTAHNSFIDAYTQHVFDHRTTSFDLDRRHRAIPCRSCHPADGPKPLARCASCHVDPHAGQLSQACGDCHQADSWQRVRFDHDQTGHTLEGRHFVAACGQCHSGQRWVGLTTTCWDCHATDAARASMEVPAHRFGRVACDDCHTSWSW